MINIPHVYALCMVNKLLMWYVTCYALLGIEPCMHMHHVVMVFVVMCISSIGVLTLSTHYIHIPSTPCMYIYPVYSVHHHHNNIYAPSIPHALSELSIICTIILLKCQHNIIISKLNLSQP